MLMKNLVVFHIPGAETLDLNALESHLQKRPFTPCTGLDWFKSGFVAPAIYQPDLMVFRQRGCALIALKREDKVLPPKVIKTKVNEKVAEIEAREKRKVGNKERRDLKEQITDDLLPRAFTKEEVFYAYIDTKHGWFVVNATSPRKAEDFVSALREAMPPFPAALPRTVVAPHAAMTDWLSAGKAPEGFELDAECELKDSSEGGAVVRCAKMDLNVEEIRQHIATGKQVTRLGLIWKERLRFKLTDTLQLKGIQFLDVVLDEVSQSSEDAAELFEAEFLITTTEFAAVFEQLINVLGGEDAATNEDE